LASLFADAGFDTVLEDIMPSNLRKAAEQLKGVGFAASVEDAVREADLVVDCVPDELESKLEIFSLLDRMSPPRAVLVTPTRTLSIADLASCTYRAERCIAVKFEDENLRTGGKLELVSTSLTSEQVLNAVESFWTKSGFSVELRTDPWEASVTAGTLF
jgi:3-hydroxybutyryl-CoA dehydrogenase